MKKEKEMQLSQAKRFFRKKINSFTNQQIHLFQSFYNANQHLSFRFIITLTFFFINFKANVFFPILFTITKDKLISYYHWIRLLLIKDQKTQVKKTNILITFHSYGIKLKKQRFN
jgi:hypothetical protein